MKKNALIGLAAGIAAGAAAAVAGTLVAGRIAKEIRDDLAGQCFTSPGGDRFVTLSCGTSDTAKGLTYIRIRAFSADTDDACQLVAFAKKNAQYLKSEWSDNDHFRLLIGSGKRRQCCDVDFGNRQITAYYSLMKVSDEA